MELIKLEVFIDNSGGLVDSNLLRMFNDNAINIKIQTKLPYLFQRADIENVRGGSVGMEVGFTRERIITSLLIHYFGIDNVDSDIPTNEKEIDVVLFDNPISIKTITSYGYSGVKLSWTVDKEKANEFARNYLPNYDILFVQINWNSYGGLFYLPKEVQKEVFDSIGCDRYIRLPKEGTNPRGGEITAEALKLICSHDKSRSIRINWIKQDINYNQFTRWVDLWEQD